MGFLSSQISTPRSQQSTVVEPGSQRDHMSRDLIRGAQVLWLAFLGGVLTIVSPCVLPVVPFVFTRAGRSFGHEGMPMLLGLAITFAIVASLATASSEWVVRANALGRVLAVRRLFPQVRPLDAIARAISPRISLSAQERS